MAGEATPGLQNRDFAMIKLFVFDLGNVILPFDHRQIATQLWNRSAKQGSLTPEAIFAFLFNREAGFVDGYETGRLSSGQFFAQLRDRLDLEMDFAAFKGIWNPIFWENRRVCEAVEYLKAKGYPLFLLSDTNELHFTYIAGKYPVVHRFDERILSYEVGVKKPAREIYDVIFAKTDVDRSEAFYIDDIECYVEAARGYGIPGMVFQGEEHLWRRLAEMGI